MENEQEVRGYEWEALEHEARTKSPDWYWGLGLAAIAGAAFSIYIGNVLFAGVIVLGAILLGAYALRPPRMEHFVIEERGVAVGNVFYPYHSLESFWVLDHPEIHPKLFLKSKKTFMPLLIVPIAGVNPNDVRDLLIEKLPEEEHHESLLELLARRIGL